MTTRIDVLVIGAGPSGLVMANLLSRAGLKIRIVDKKAGPTQESRAIVVHARTLELLDRLGLAERAIEEGERLLSAEVLNQGRPVGTISFDANGRTPYPFGLIYGQDQTEHLLLQSLAQTSVPVEWNTEMVSLEQTPDNVRVQVRATDGSEETIEARWVVGADGAHSPVRHTLSLGFAGQSYAQSLFVADLDMEWALGHRQAALDQTRQGFFLFMPMRGEGRFRLFGSLPPEMAKRNAMTLDDVRQVLDTQSNMHVDIQRARWISVYHTHQRMAERFRVGRVFLVGDAAHIHSPAGGQGMNTGIGDAFNLAWKLALVVKGQAYETLLDSYEAERMPFARSILRGSDQGFQVEAATNPALRWFKLSVIPWLFPLVSPLSVFRQRFFWLLSQLWTSYRNSPAVMDAQPEKKGPRAGDRAPYGIFEVGPDAGKSIFTLLRDQDHHLFLFTGETHTLSYPERAQLQESIQALLSAYPAPIHLHIISAENRSLHTVYRADTPVLFFIRPDGHIAYHGKAEDIAGLKSYLNRLFNKNDIPVRTPEISIPASEGQQGSSIQAAGTDR